MNVIREDKPHQILILTIASEVKPQLTCQPVQAGECTERGTRYELDCTSGSN